MNRRSHAAGLASAHMIAVAAWSASDSNRRMPEANLGVVM
jgi:hypothetical protein